MAIELIEQQGSRAQPTQELFPVGGLNVDLPSTELNEAESPSLKNIMFHRYSARSRPGLSLMGSNGLPVTGIPVGLFSYTKLDQTRYFVLMTTSELYKFDSVGQTWSSIKGSVDISCISTDFASAAFFPTTTTDTLIMTNGSDVIIKWNGSGNAAALTCPYKAKIVSPYRDYLLLINCEVSGTWIPQRVIWGDIGQPEVFTGGTSGQYDIISGGSNLIAAEKLRGVVYLYTEESIVSFWWVGGQQVFRWEEVVPGIGLAGKRTVGDFGDFHILLGWENVLLFDGTQHLQRLADGKVQEDLIGNINYDYIDNAFSIVDRKLGMYSLFVPEGSSQWPTARWVYNHRQGLWTRYDYDLFYSLLDDNDETAGFCVPAHYKDFTGLTWEQAEGAWTAWTARRWRDRDVSKDAPRIAFASNTKNVYEESEIALDDAGTAIDNDYQTKDFQVGSYTRTIKLEFEAIGTTVDISYSTDEGNSWTSLETVTLDAADYNRYEVFLDTFGSRLRFRFRNISTTGWFELRKYRFWAIPRK